ncbi:hypothetical protein BP5796_09195 [Coleophoma crateriformis]|uniref:Velvet domain-containing protein n=1 Tax=Coleophoma crateriformis TaxID=565419 RepID=A0A3D8R3K9_9HELO|nr:hypothetical protein BP5796_09195 [Coleophoma crateriformis]
MQAQAYPPHQGPPYGGDPYRRPSHFEPPPPPTAYTGAVVGSNNPPAESMEKHIRMLVQDGRKYELRVEQQPQRARMCGFGDKDRRPITPPPCVRLVITDATTGLEIDMNLIDHSMYVLNVDLWDEHGQRELNLVRHSSTSPSIGASIPASYPQEQSVPAPYSNILPQGPPQHQTSPTSYGHPGGYGAYPGPPPVQQYQRTPSYPGPQYNNPFPNGGHNGYPPNNGYPSGPPNGAPPGYAYQSPVDRQSEYIPAGEVAPRNHSSLLGYNNERAADMGMQRPPISSAQPTGMFTRNLIGSLSASAFRLTDTSDKIGIWFVLQDLSVRTEGNFRLRFSFVNVGIPKAMEGPNASSTVNTGRAPILAACFSEPFTVFSAKRFPGVVESTPLSKCFATQGIKIPIRKDGQAPRGGANGAGGGARDDEEDDAY